MKKSSSAKTGFSSLFYNISGRALMFNGLAIAMPLKEVRILSNRRGDFDV